MIGYVMPTGTSVDIDPHFVEFLSGLGDYARTHDLDLVLSPTTADDEETTYRRVVANKQVDAVYVSSPRPADRSCRSIRCRVATVGGGWSARAAPISAD